jgi:multisubunit Na+/H+ antiporter MnhC subunit
MASARVQELGLAPPTARAQVPARRSTPSPRAPLALAAALLAVCLYAACDHGAAAGGANERVQLALTVVSAMAAAAWLWSGRLTLRAPAIVWAGVALLVGFAVWSGITLAWSVAPDQTWSECNRAITYVLFLVLAIALGSSYTRAQELISAGFLAIALTVTAYALGQKLLPGLHLDGIFHLDQTALLTRLQEPFGYWNALALFISVGVPCAVAIAVDRRYGPGVRLAASVVSVLMLETIAFTYSRGGVLALALGLAVAIALSGARLRYLMWLGLICAAAAAPLVIGLLSHDLTAAGVALSTRERAGLELAAVLFACLTLLVLGGRRVIMLERRARLSRHRARRVGRALVLIAAAVVVVALLAVSLSPRGLTGTASHAWRSFTATRATGISNPSRLLSADSENRWVWWKEAAGAFGDRPIGGWGAGSFAVVHLLYRRDTLSVQQPHSLPLQFLVETGIVGALLGLGGLALLLGAGVAAVRQRQIGGGRLPAAALLAGAVVYSVHSLYDWDWDIPGVTLPALLFLGALGGSLGRTAARTRRPPAARAADRPEPQVGPLARALALAAIVAGLASFAASVVLPRLAAAKASQALVTASRDSTGHLQAALAMALDASHLDPLSDAGLRAASTIEVHLGRLSQARRLTLEALMREPTDDQAWQQLTFLDFALGANREALAAAQRAHALDPHGSAAVSLAAGAMLSRSPPAGSATAVATPSSAGAGAP